MGNKKAKEKEITLKTLRTIGHAIKPRYPGKPGYSGKTKHYTEFKEKGHEIKLNTNATFSLVFTLSNSYIFNTSLYY